jgi:hypothetical protein
MDDRFNRRVSRALVIVATAMVALVRVGPAHAQGAVTPTPDASQGLRFDPSLSLDPTLPQVGAMPGGLTPAFGQRSLSEGEWRFDFHGYILAPLNAGINSRPNPGFNYNPNLPQPQPGQSKTVLHSPPVVPDDLETFSHTGVVPTTYVQLNFSEGNSIVTGNVSILAKQANVSESFLEPADQLGITDVFLSVLPPLGERVHMQALLGAYTLRYGSTGEYDEGRYGTPLIARITGVGEHVALKTGWHKYTFVLEEGVHGQTNAASSSITPDVSNNFADPGSGSTFVAHVHGGVGYTQQGMSVMVGGHFMRAFSQDDRDGTSAPDGRIDVYAGDVRLNLGRFGHFYGALSYTDALQARTVSRIISILNTQGGKGLMDNYLGAQSGGTGTLLTVGGQYDLSIGRLVSYPVPFSGDGPDLFVSLFGMQTHVSSLDKIGDPKTGLPYDGVTKRKFGVEATYSLLSWLAASARFDRVDPDVDDTRFSFSVISPRIIFHTGWQSTDQVVLQYSHWFNGGLTTVRVGDPPAEDITVIPDGDMLSLSARMWW